MNTRDSRSECVSCGATLGGELSPHQCQACGAPQPVGAGETFFSAFGYEKPRLGVDPEFLEKRFYQISRSLHPDRFASLGRPEWHQASLARMAFLNDAYSTLKRTEDRRAYVLQLAAPGDSAGGEAGPQPALPVELAETWFELQEAVLDDPGSALERLRAFEAELRSRAESHEAEAKAAEAEFDAGGGSASLRRLQRVLKQAQYLKSLLRDVQRLKVSGHGSSA